VSGRTETKVKEPEKSRFVRPGFYLWKLILPLGLFVLALWLASLYLAPFSWPRSSAGGSTRR
jgi:hypothetical protein